MRQEVDSPAPRAREQIRERAQLLLFWFGEEPIGGGLDHRIRIAHRYDGAREDTHFDRSGRARVVDVRGLIRDVEIHVDHLARQGRARREQRDLLRLSRATIDHRRTVQPANHPDRACIDVAQESRDDKRHENEYRDRNRNRQDPLGQHRHLTAKERRVSDRCTTPYTDCGDHPRPQPEAGHQREFGRLRSGLRHARWLAIARLVHRLRR